MIHEMKAKCIRRVRVNGLQFKSGEMYHFEAQAFTEEYKPSLHPKPARGYHIRYIRYKVTLPLTELDLTDGPNGMVECRTVYFYDHSYCLLHNWKDERGQETECFDDHFSICEHEPAVAVPTRKKPLWAGLPKLISDKPIKMSEDIVEYMKRNWKEQMYKNFGGLSPDDWDYDAYVRMLSEINKTDD